MTAVAGNGDYGDGQAGIPATQSPLGRLSDVAVDSQGRIYVPEASSNRVLSVDLAGLLTVAAGTGNFGAHGDGGPAASAQLWRPSAVAVSDSDTLYIADRLNNLIRRVTSDGIITTIAGSGMDGYDGDGAPATMFGLRRPEGIGLAHVQFETIHPFLDGNGRIGRLLIALLIEHWGLLNQPLLYISLAFRREQQEYFARLAAVRSHGDWEGWNSFFLECVRDAAQDGVRVSQTLHALVGEDRKRIIAHHRSTLATVQLLERLPSNPVVTVRGASELLALTAPPTRKAIQLLERLGVLREITSKRRGRVYAYNDYLRILTGDEE